MIRRALVITTLVAAAPAYAQEAPTAQPAAAERGIIGVVASVGVYSGFAAGVRIGDDHLGVLVTGAWQPLFIATKADNAFDVPQADYHFHSSLQANADAYLLLSNPTPRSSVGLSAGYKGSTHLGHGAAAGFYAEIDSRKRVSYFLLAGVTYFWNGENRLRAKENYAMDAEFVFPGPALNFGANLGIAFSP
jgi:hypothetical protein